MPKPKVLLTDRISNIDATPMAPLPGDNKRAASKENPNSKTHIPNGKAPNTNQPWSGLVWLWIMVGIAFVVMVGVGWWVARPTIGAKEITLSIPIEPGSAPLFAGALTTLRHGISAPRTEVNPINGELFTPAEFKTFSGKPIIVAMIENQVDARPQAGFAQADVVYETLAEGGISRMMAVFWSNVNEVKSIGPIRSIRNYYLELGRPYDGLFMHIGCASSNDARVNACGNRYSYGIKTMDISNTFYRVNYKFAPHNAYTSPKILYDVAKRLNRYTKPNLKDVDDLQFKTDALPADRGKSMRVKVRFLNRLANYGLYDVEWRYDAKRNQYLRYMAGKPHNDENTKKQIAVKTVVIEDVVMISTGDAKGHLIFNVVGKGGARVLQDGKSYKVQWEKTSRNKRETFTMDGKPFQFNRGPMWVQLLPKGQGTLSIK